MIEKDDLIQTVDDLEFSHEKANARYNTLYADYEKSRVDFEQKVEEKENEARDVAQKLQTLIDTERSKLEFEQKCSNDLKRYIIYIKTLIDSNSKTYLISFQIPQETSKHYT